MLSENFRARRPSREVPTVCKGRSKVCKMEVCVKNQSTHTFISSHVRKCQCVSKICQHLSTGIAWETGALCINGTCAMHIYY